MVALPHQYYIKPSNLFKVFLLLHLIYLYFVANSVTKQNKQKKHGGPASKKEIIIPGQMFHMDILFIIGPSKLEEILGKGSKPTKTIKKSREGYIGFLTIIDVASQYIWTQPIRNKDPPLIYVDHFLQKHELHKKYSAVITTSPDGYVAKAKAF